MSTPDMPREQRYLIVPFVRNGRTWTERVFAELPPVWRLRRDRDPSYRQDSYLRIGDSPTPRSMVINVETYHREWFVDAGGVSHVRYVHDLDLREAARDGDARRGIGNPDSDWWAPANIGTPIAEVLPQRFGVELTEIEQFVRMFGCTCIACDGQFDDDDDAMLELFELRDRMAAAAALAATRAATQAVHDGD